MSEYVHELSSLWIGLLIKNCPVKQVMQATNTSTLVARIYTNVQLVL